MARPLVSDELWELIEPLIPQVKRRHRYPGRKRLDDRKVLTGILFVLRTGIPWEYLPQEMGSGSGMTCWRRLREWQEAGVWQRLHEVLLMKLLAVSLTGGNRNDITQLIPLVDAIPPVRGRRGRPRRHPLSLYGDRACHSREGRSELRRRHIQARIAWPRSGHGSGLGTKRWVVERTIAWLHQYRRLRIRYERRDDIHEAFLAIGCSLICLKLLQPERSFC